MSLRITTNVNIDFYDKKYIMINAKQCDTGSRLVAITCYDNGNLFNLDASQHTAYIRCRKADDNVVFNSCRINDRSEVLVELTEQMLAVEGICYVDLMIVNKGSAIVNIDTGEITTVDGSAIISTMAFCISVYEAAVDNSLIGSSDEGDALNELLQNANANYQEVIQLAKSYAIGDADNIRENEDKDNSKYYSELAKDFSQQALNSALKASEYADDATQCAYYYVETQNLCSNAETFATNAKHSAENASSSASQAQIYANDAASSASIADYSKSQAENYASQSRSLAREANLYLGQVESIANGLNGAFSPKGTVTFAELLELKNNHVVTAGYLYHISDDFVTDENFRVSGKECGAGTSVYYTVDGVFDYFVGTTVAGVKGAAEIEYRTGAVNLTAENVGAIPSADIATVDEIKTYLGI